MSPPLLAACDIYIDENTRLVIIEFNYKKLISQYQQYLLKVFELLLSFLDGLSLRLQLLIQVLHRLVVRLRHSALK